MGPVDTPSSRGLPIFRPLSRSIEFRGNDFRPNDVEPSHLVTAVVALVTDADESRRSDVGVADDAATVALLAKTADGDARLLPAEDQVRMVLGHDEAIWK